MKSSIRKFSVVIYGSKTSISLEPEFYAELKRLARERNANVNYVVEGIAAVRNGKNLSSEIRLAVLRDLRKRAGIRNEAAEVAPVVEQAAYDDMTRRELAE